MLFIGTIIPQHLIVKLSLSLHLDADTEASDSLDQQHLQHRHTERHQQERVSIQRGAATADGLVSLNVDKTKDDC